MRVGRKWDDDGGGLWEDARIQVKDCVGLLYPGVCVCGYFIVKRLHLQELAVDSSVRERQA